jgi:hypothetical protein
LFRNDGTKIETEWKNNKENSNATIYYANKMQCNLRYENGEIMSKDIFFKVEKASKTLDHYPSEEELQQISN